MCYESEECVSEADQSDNEAPDGTYTFCVGPIWGQHEASAKADAWIQANRPGQGYTFTGPTELKTRYTGLTEFWCRGVVE